MKGKSAIERVVSRLYAPIAILAIAMIATHLLLKFGLQTAETIHRIPLLTGVIGGGIPLLAELVAKVLRRDFGSDLLAGVSIIASSILGEYLAGALVVLMLSGGQTIESYAVASASHVLRVLSNRMPNVAHRRRQGMLTETPVTSIDIGDEIAILPHEICPIDGTVIEGHGTMDESYLTGEPYVMSKTPGSLALSGAINGETMLLVRAEKKSQDSRFAQILKVIQQSEQERPRIRRIADLLGSFYTPVALVIAAIAWLLSGDPIRFLAVLVVATPCPLLIAIPVAIIGSISLAAKRAIVVRNPSALEMADRCETIILDKTGTLTYGQPKLVEMTSLGTHDLDWILSRVGSLEKYSKHPLATALVKAAAEKDLPELAVESISEKPGEGLSGRVNGHLFRVTNRVNLMRLFPQVSLPPIQSGLECVVLVDEKPAALCRFRDAPRAEGGSFIKHLRPNHQIAKTMIVSGDRQSEVEYLAELVGIELVHAEQSPEQKLNIVKNETARAKTLYIGDGINDAPALMAATIGIAFGKNSDVTMNAADVVVMDSSLQKVDEFLHISRRMRKIALQSAVGGIALSLGGMLLAAAGYLPPVVGALGQEAIDVLAVFNALRAAWPPRQLADF